MKKGYIIIEPDEDGNPIRYYESLEELNEALNSEEDVEYMKEVPGKLLERDPNYWDKHKLVLKFEVVEIIPTKVEFRIKEDKLI